MIVRSSTIRVLAAALVVAAAVPLAADTTTVDFSSGAQGWSGPSGPGGATTIDPTGGNPGHNMHTVFNNFGIEFTTNTNSAFLGDYTQYDSVEISIDVKVNSIAFFGSPVGRDLILDLRSYDLGDPGYPWASVWFNFGTLNGNGTDWQTLTATISNPSSSSLPAGWGGYGAEDPNTFEPVLPAGVSFSDVLADVDEASFSTYVPGFFFGFTDFDVQIDNIRITTTTVPAPGALALLGLASLTGSRRRRA